MAEAKKDNNATTEDNTEANNVIADAEAKAAEVVAGAEAKATEIVEEAKAKAAEIIADAEKKAKTKTAATTAKQKAGEEIPEWKKEDYTGPLSGEQADWRMKNFGVNKPAKTKTKAAKS